MDKEYLEINDISESLLRFLSRPKNYFGNITLKYFSGELKNVIAEDSFDMRYLKEKKIKGANMFVKHGTASIKDKESSKILTEVKVDEQNKIIKESKIIKEDESNKKD